MSYKILVVEQAIASLKHGGFAYAEIFKVMFEKIYDCGYNEAIRNLKNKQNSSYTDTKSDGGMDPR